MTAFTDRDGVLTDDSDRWLSGHETTFEYDPVPDFDDGPSSEFRCGRGPLGIPCCRDDDGAVVSDGCRHCNPPDYEGKPYGWGLERFEDPALERANCEVKAMRPVALYTTAGAYAREEWTGRIVEVVAADGRRTYRREMRVVVGTPAYRDTMDTRDMLWRAYSTWDAKLADRAERLWVRLCENCATHPEAVAKYTKWAERATGRKRAK